MKLHIVDVQENIQVVPVVVGGTRFRGKQLVPVLLEQVLVVLPGGGSRNHLRSFWGRFPLHTDGSQLLKGVSGFSRPARAEILDSRNFERFSRRFCIVFKKIPGARSSCGSSGGLFFRWEQ